MMTAARGVRFDAEGPVGQIVLERPDAANAFDLPAAEAFGAAVTQASAPAVRAVTLTGEGKRFCAGGDVRSFVTSTEPSAYLLTLANQLADHLNRLAQLPKPVVAGVHGAVAGAGLAFLLNADLVVAGRGTKFVFAYPAIGLTPDCGVSWLLPRVIGQQRALDLAMTGRVLTAAEASDWGLVSEVVDDELVAARTAEVAVALGTGPTQAFGEVKRLMRGSFEVSRAENAKDEAETIARMVGTGDAQRLIARFLG